MLDLTAAFNTVDHNILIDRLEHRFALSNVVLGQFWFYLKDGDYFVTVGGYTSELLPIMRGVLQGPMIGPLLFNLNVLPLVNFFSNLLYVCR